jgi:hypothetical protein
MYVKNFITYIMILCKKPGLSLSIRILILSTTYVLSTDTFMSNAQNQTENFGLSSDLFKLQITNPKKQTNNNGQNSKSQTKKQSLWTCFEFEI